MDKERKDILQKFFTEYKGICLGLRTWINCQDKNFNLIDALNCIYDAVDGNFKEMEKVIRQILDKGKTTVGRTQVYAPPINQNNKIDIINKDGKLTLINYNPNKKERLKGQKGGDNPLIFRKSDGQTKKTVLKKEDIIYDVGKGVRELFPNASVSLIQNVIQAVLKYAQEKKINTKKVLLSLESGKLVYDPRLGILRQSAKENKIIVISENVLKEIYENDDLEMTEYKFNSNVKFFLGELLADPVNAKPSFLLTSNGLNRSKLIQLLIKNNILIRTEKICDKDENGELKTATMKVKYQVPKKDFKHKLKKLYIKLFERNIPQHTIISEDGEGGGCVGATSADASGAFEPAFGRAQRRKMPTSIAETDTCSVGNYEYTAPSFGDKETLARKNGVGGSVSINKV